ncbi:MAG: hypothetical protein ROY99_00250 [Ignavibacterium sp.]|nr:hypothetical protein [Ignavibacterium sp.]
MKTGLFEDKNYLTVVVSILFTLMISTTMAQNHKVADLCNHKYAKQNLITAIHSSNMGVRESAVYLTGKYRFVDLEDELIKQLQVESEADIKVLIGLALFRMNSEKGMRELKEVSIYDQNLKVRQMSQAICKEYFENNPDNKITAQ